MLITTDRETRDKKKKKSIHINRQAHTIKKEEEKVNAMNLCASNNRQK